MKTVVIGAGRMGHGLALCYAMGGHDVIVVDSNEEALKRAAGLMDAAASLLVEARIGTRKGLQRALARISCSADLTSATATADLVQEAVPEELATKQRLFAEVEAVGRADAILGTNTSSLRLDAIGRLMHRPERLVGMHWVAPPYLVPIVEIVRGSATPAPLVDRARNVVEALGKIAIVVPDVPGFALNRLQYALHAAAVDLIDKGILGPREVDLVIRYAMAPRLLAFGVLEQFDLIVNSRTVRAVANYLYEETGDGRYRPSARVDRMVEAGRLGLISGGGWFDYEGPQADIERRRDQAFAQAYRALAELDKTTDAILIRDPSRREDQHQEDDS